MTKYKVSIEITLETGSATLDMSQTLQERMLAFLALTRGNVVAFNNKFGGVTKIIGYSVHTKQVQKPLEVKL